jgi:hypothetical protein
MKYISLKSVLIAGITLTLIETSIVSGFDLKSINNPQLSIKNWSQTNCNNETYPSNAFPRTLIEQDPMIINMIQQISQSNIYNTVYTLQNFTSRYYPYAGNTEASTWLYNKLSNIPGLTVEYKNGIYRNIIATLPGQDTTSSSIYMVGAHYDSLNDADPSYSPGACDNGGGVAIVLELARIMSQYTFNHTLMFVFWNDEEGYLSGTGSLTYAHYAKDNNLNISLYENFDSSCYDPDDHFILDIMYNNQSQWVSEIMTQHNNLYNINFTLTYNVHDCGSDHSSFWALGYTAVTTHSETHGYAHTQYDTVDKVSTDYAKKNGQLGMSLLAYLSEVQHNTAPKKPDRPSGETNGEINIEYTYTTKTIDPDGDQVSYNWSWGDGSYSGWLGPFMSNTTTYGNHTWTKKGLHIIKVKAKDLSGHESAWSDNLLVIMPLDIIFGNTLFLKQLKNSLNIFTFLKQSFIS